MSLQDMKIIPMCNSGLNRTGLIVQQKRMMLWYSTIVRSVEKLMPPRVSTCQCTMWRNKMVLLSMATEQLKCADT